MAPAAGAAVLGLGRPARGQSDTLAAHVTLSLPEGSGPVAKEPRFGFGQNWSRYLTEIDPRRLATATSSLISMLGRSRLDGLTFLDVGCGSGLFSLAARQLGARVHSFDYDADSVACTLALREDRRSADPDWKVELGDALDDAYLASLGRFDVVYAWGVLHHTGDLWRALRLAADLPKPNGQLFLAVYNDQGVSSRLWKRFKRAYNVVPRPLRAPLLAIGVARLWGPTTVKDVARGRPMATWHTYQRERGMSPWRDVVDWVGGYPFEVAAPEALRELFEQLGYQLERERLVGSGRGCNEFVFRRAAA